jgi:hypothetical protein
MATASHASLHLILTLHRDTFFPARLLPISLGERFADLLQYHVTGENAFARHLAIDLALEDRSTLSLLHIESANGKAASTLAFGHHIGTRRLQITVVVRMLPSSATQPGLLRLPFGRHSERRWLLRATAATELFRCHSTKVDNSAASSSKRFSDTLLLPKTSFPVRHKNVVAAEVKVRERVTSEYYKEQVGPKVHG